ncbi:hypothetical protein FKW77_009112 [Venturia effusa]|uniref:Rab-GAP TBC domain-containing protein n=1 Tax=Venturia effusa TaxID=50376 RepID=A0A517LG61_9PEZI|nr:hypothetical protein FKW77_009112 [Venturia effusa]
MDSRGSPGAGTLRGGKRTSTSSSIASNKSRQNSISEAPPASPKVFTSFPNFSPPPSASPKRKRSSKETSKLGSSAESLQAGGQSRRTSGENTSSSSTIKKSSGESGPSQVRKSTSSFAGKTLKGAANLHKSILASLTFSSAVPQVSPDGVFDDPDWDASDPLENATDDQIQRVIDRNGGAISLLKQYSQDLAESNSRVAQERNGKLEVIERNRRLRDESDQMKLQLEDMQRKYKNVQNLLKRFVRPEHPGQIQIVDSPNGHFVLDSTTGEMVEATKPLRKPFIASVDPSLSTAAFSTKESPSKPASSDASTSLKQIASQRRASKDSRSLRGASISVRPDSLPTRPESLELTAPVDAEQLPPALRLDNPLSNIGPVDRLGFFFTASRETRQNEALIYKPGDSSETSSLNSYEIDPDDLDGKTMRLHDDASSFTTTLNGASDGELLCYAPSGPALRFVSGPDKSIRMFVDVSVPSTPSEGITVTTVEAAQSAATVAQASASGTMVTPTQDSNRSSEALGTLLDKFNEVFDNQQTSRMSEWTAFHNHLRANIPKTLSRASSDYSTANIARLCSKGTVSAETLKRFNNLILSGIPVAVRREVWMERTGANALSEPGLYTTLVTNASIPLTTRNEITADIDRTLGNNIFFRTGAGKAKLQDILTAYAQHNPTIGYSQGLNIIAANLLLMLPSAEDAFWLLVACIENILPFEYYHHDGTISGQSLDIDGKVLTSYVVDHLGAQLHKHLRVHGVDLSMFTPGWFISAFAACLSGEPLYRIWDVLFGFCDGRYMFCFALALLKINRRGLLKCESAEELMLYLGGRMTNAAVGLDVLVKEGVRMGTVVTTEDLKKRRKQLGQVQMS